MDLDRIRGDIFPILLVVVAGLLILWLARPYVHRLLLRVFESQARSDPAAALSPAEIEKRAATVEALAMSTIRIVVTLLVVALVLVILNLGAVIAGLGLVLAAFAFAGQDLVRDYLAGLVILLENHYSIGDVVRTAGVSGVVEDFSLRRTKLRDLNGTLHVVANNEVRKTASNLTRGFSGINIEVPIAHDADVAGVMALIDEVGTGLAADPAWRERILDAPAAIRIGELGDLGPSVTVRGRVRPGEQWDVTGELRRRILAAFGEANVRMPRRIVVIEPTEREGIPATGPTARSD